VLLPVAVAALPVVLLLSSLRTFRELDDQKAVFLRNLAAIVAGKLENLPASATGETAFEQLSEDEPNLVDLELLDSGTAESDPQLSGLWNGRELFRTEFSEDDGGRIFRAWVPFHSGGSLRIARIDLDAGAADFLVAHARHNVIASSAGGLVLVLLALYGIWATRRAARLKMRQLELEHLAHLGKMAAVLAHEIRNPLGTIKGFAQLAGERADTGTRALVEPIVGEARRLENLVNDLLLYGRPPVPAMRRAAWLETLDPLRAHAQHMTAGRDIRFHAEDAALEWSTDPQLLQQVLLNLVRNAVDAVADSGGEVRVDARAEADGGVTVAVTDDGPGIPESAKDKLFEPFFTTKASGTGLGLAVSRKLAESMGAQLTLSPAEPRGVKALLRFPNAAAGAVKETERHGNDSCSR
jgi:signal transduction histidine kinase